MNAATNYNIDFQHRNNIWTRYNNYSFRAESEVFVPAIYECSLSANCIILLPNGQSLEQESSIE